MERRTIMDIRMFMRMEQFMRVITIMSQRITFTAKRNTTQKTMTTVKKNTVQKTIFTVRMTVTVSRLNMMSTSGHPRSMRKSWSVC